MSWPASQIAQAQSLALPAQATNIDPRGVDPRGSDPGQADEPFMGTTQGTPDFIRDMPPPEETVLSLADPFKDTLIPLSSWTNELLEEWRDPLRELLYPLRWPVDYLLGTIEAMMLAASPYLVILMVFLIAWQASSKLLGIVAAGAMILVGALGIWEEAMVTLSIVISAVIFCTIVGLPLGVAAGRNDRFEASIRPILDAMQTTPSFVYLVPVVMLFGIGNVPGVIVTIAFALPPLVRLTNLGIRQTPSDLVEAARALGASESQILFRVQFPLALPTIMAGVNQALMLAMSMVVIASMISVGGLGRTVLQGLGRLDVGHALVGGIGIVIIAIVLDRITQEMARDGQSGSISAPTERRRHWWETGPIGLVLSLQKRLTS